MIEFRLNLIRDQVPTPAQRVLRYRLMMLYLAVAGLVLVVCVALASQRLVQAGALRTQSQHLESLFGRGREGSGDGLITGASRIKNRLSAQAKALQASDQLMAGDPRPARLLRAMVRSLPPGITVRMFSLNREDRSVNFELLAIGGGEEGQGGPTDLINHWQKDEELSTELKDINYTGSQVEGVGGRSEVIWRFTGRLAKGGG